MLLIISMLEFFPVLFAIPRMPGYLSHWKESLDNTDTNKIRCVQVSFPHDTSNFLFHFRDGIRNTILAVQRYQISRGLKVLIKLTKKIFVVNAFFIDSFEILYYILWISFKSVWVGKCCQRIGYVFTWSNCFITTLAWGNSMPSYCL